MQDGSACRCLQILQLGTRDLGLRMKTIGLLGGMSWESTAEYYRIINEEVNRRLGKSHSAECVLYSFDFDRIERLQETGRWDEAAAALITASKGLVECGAELLVICTNTMHLLAPQIAEAVSIPLVHIADTTADAVRSQGLAQVGLLGTRYTMEEEFYRGRLETTHGLSVLVPDEPDRTFIHDVIYEELVKGIIHDSSRAGYRRAIHRLIDDGAEGIIAGCTEIELLVTADDVPVPYFPTTRLHALAAVDRALDAPT
jgi:aspartate racemase